MAMNRYKLSKAGVNATEGIARFGGDKDAYEAVLNSFTADKSFERLKAAFSAAHSLKGIAGNLSMTRLFDDVVPLVEELRAGSMEHSAALLAPVEKDYAEVMAVLAPVG